MGPPTRKPGVCSRTSSMKYSPAAVFGRSRLLYQYGVFRPQSQPLFFLRVNTSASFVPAWLRQVLYADPENRFEPARVVMRICAEPWPALSAPGLDVDTVISSTESISGLMYMKKPSVDRLLLSCTFTPSSVMLIEPVGSPLIVVARLLPVPGTRAPGSIVTKS